ncbi:chemotaxis protein [Epibacterium sp. SM1969]|uniref:Chemotaxis protein n=1 Tax=Tritonibacter aquimaris TaxID=2663379 RepID=A0A844AJX3_9RHOB|nr:methyl-accepting chemotaxis protein [Tritonibacter aquimaris]MQY41169.1 chemotaxis protein [Tritonibacter aquimaris]
MQNLIELQNTAFTAIGPSRIAALSLMALLSDTSNSENAQKTFQLSATRLENAHTMLGTRLPELLKKLEHSFPRILEEQRLACIEVLEPLLKIIKAANGDVTSLPSPNPEFANHCLYVLEPKLTDFLTAMTQNLLDTQKTRNLDREKEMLEAISDAESVGRNIQLIAFNASIEAARIGDMGKGFAVIATEIRELSGKTQVLLDDIAGFLRH